MQRALRRVAICQIGALLSRAVFREGLFQQNPITLSASAMNRLLASRGDVVLVPEQGRVWGMKSRSLREG
jgi:hypothetical protein